jgi:hypothetical protein
MIRSALRSLFGAALALALSQGCAAPAGPPPRAVVTTEYYYGPSPYHYDRHVVYYDVSGRPIYFVAGVWRRVPVHYRHYDIMVRDYHRHRDVYTRRPYERRRPSHPPPRAPSERRHRHAD